MTRKNPFDGKGAYTKFVWLIYKRIMSREWFSHADVMADKLGCKSSKELEYSISKCPNNGELRKAFRDIIKFVEDKVGGDCIEIRGNNRNKEFRYVGIMDNPLEDFQSASAINDIRTYAQFCEDSAGFFPRSWLEYFFEDTIDLLKINQIRKSGEQIISSSIDRELTNIHLLPLLYEAIRSKQVLNISYKPYDEELITLKFHPHLLKEHNGRWFLFGHATGKDPDFGYNLALDRIVGEPTESREIDEYISAPNGFYDDFFKNIVGVSHSKDETPTTIVVRATNHKVYKLVETKRIHHSQIVKKKYALYNDGEYGEFELFIEVNNEFIGRILQMGDGLVIVSPAEIKNKFKQCIENLSKLYE